MSIWRGSNNNNPLLLLVLVVSFVLAGCEGATEDDSSGNPSNTPSTGSAQCLTEYAGYVDQIGVANPIYGGLLYDKWWSTKGVLAPEATDTNPLWSLQNTNTRSGADTWRCKECHGWDYAGRDGVYGDTTNSHYTGFPGVLDVASEPAINIFCKIRDGSNINADHSFSTKLEDADILHLTRFIIETQSGVTPQGMIDTSSHISDSGSVIGGSSTAGETLYGSAGCAAAGCHGAGSHFPEGPLADLAISNPWETLHKIRFGHPGSEMPSFADPAPPTLTLQQSKDVLAFTQTLAPDSGSDACLTDFASLVGQIGLADPTQGGLLYDKWWTAAGVATPTQDHPLWVTQNTNARTGADTWRCKECHGWDYAGNEGVYGDTTNSHYTGFPGVLPAAGGVPINVFCSIHSGTGIDSRHNFSNELDSVSILHLTRFLIENQTGTTPRGMIDTSPHISSTGTVLNANHTNGESLYATAGCGASTCHGTNSTFPEGDLANLAVGNPWETLHKIRFGHPGSPMPSYSHPAAAPRPLSLDESKDVLAHTQTLAPSQPGSCATDFAGLVAQIGSADAQQGGQLYDKWWAAAGAQAPTTDHPLWSLQTTNTRTGADTWRCKECHGWDYDGNLGVYGDPTNSHYTGFPSILSRTAGAQPIDVFCAIRSGAGINSAHNFTTVMSDTQILHLTKFITETRTGTMPMGIIDTSGLINGDGSLNGTNVTAGNSLYGSQGCGASTCHGANGDAQHEWLGDLADDNPWETLHKIRFGHPGSSPVMPAFASIITLSQSNDIIAYAQTLPNAPAGGGGGGTPPPVTDAAMISMGGRLYDNWISETGSAAPPVTNPVWALQPDPDNRNERTGAATWRCKECHGWDYKGVDGIYGNPSNSHYTGFGGILNTEKTEQQIVTYLTTGFYNPILGENVHVFDGLLSAEEIQALAMFIKQGMIDSSPYFGSDAIINGSFANFQNGEFLYSFQGFAAETAGCELCHGADGLGEQGVNLGDIARTNPWEFLHKIRFGQPATLMPSMFDAVDANGILLFDTQDTVDVIQYSQSLSLP